MSNMTLSASFALAEAWEELHSGEELTEEKQKEFLYECAYYGAKYLTAWHRQ